MTTLAEMTPEQREQCVGMWFDHPDLGLCVLSNARKHGLAYVSFSRDAGATVYHISELGFSEITPRPDLPRAWQPGGTPVEMDVEGADYRPGTNRGFYILDETIQKGRELQEGTTRARRFVGEWEEE